MAKRKAFRSKKIARRADNGQITTLAYAKAHPRTTVVETVRVPLKKRK